MVLWAFSSNRISVRIYSLPLGISYFYVRSFASRCSRTSPFYRDTFYIVFIHPKLGSISCLLAMPSLFFCILS